MRENTKHVSYNAARFCLFSHTIPCRIGSLAIKKQIAYAGMGIVTVLVSLLLLSTLVGWSLWLTLLCGVAHASFRDATTLIDAAEANQVRTHSKLYTSNQVVSQYMMRPALTALRCIASC
jgi:hypothetical protein